MPLLGLDFVQSFTGPDRPLALVDCNSIYASWRKGVCSVPGNRPVVVLSNNDGCILVRSAEAKTAGIPMGELAVACRELFRRQNADDAFLAGDCFPNYLPGQFRSDNQHENSSYFAH